MKSKLSKAVYLSHTWPCYEPGGGGWGWLEYWFQGEIQAFQLRYKCWLNKGWVIDGNRVDLSLRHDQGHVCCNPSFPPGPVDVVLIGNGLRAMPNLFHYHHTSFVVAYNIYWWNALLCLIPRSNHKIDSFMDDLSNSKPPKKR